MKNNKMTEKVYCAHDQHDGIILSGVADFNGQHYYFSRIFDSGLTDNWTDIYQLTILDSTIFNLEIKNWKYWLYWLNSQNDPHPVEYADIRKTETIDSVKKKKIFESAETLRKAETYYQNQLIINTFFKSHNPTVFAKADFIGDCDGIDTQVIWTIII